MIVLKNINNNVSLCLDSRNNEVIVFGKGVGFIKPPYEIPLSKIDKTFYNVNEEYISLFNLIPDEILKLASDAIEYASRKLNCQFSSNVLFALADHLQFAIKRQETNINLKLPILREIEQSYLEECQIGRHILKMIKKELHVELPPQEAAAIALHLINGEVTKSKKEEKNNGELVNACVDLVCDQFQLTVNKKGFNYYRFVTHLYYLLKRVQSGGMIESKNLQIYESMKSEFPEIYVCANEIAKLIERKQNKRLSEEEIMYLMLHINRLCSREDCDQ